MRRLTVGAFVVVVILRKVVVGGGGLVIMIGIVLVVAIVLVVVGVVGRSNPISASLFIWKSFWASTGNTTHNLIRFFYMNSTRGSNSAMFCNLFLFI